MVLTLYNGQFRKGSSGFDGLDFTQLFSLTGQAKLTELVFDNKIGKILTQVVGFDILIEHIVSVPPVTPAKNPLNAITEVSLDFVNAQEWMDRKRGGSEAVNSNAHRILPVICTCHAAPHTRTM